MKRHVRCAGKDTTRGGGGTLGIQRGARGLPHAAYLKEVCDRGTCGEVLKELMGPFGDLSPFVSLSSIGSAVLQLRDRLGNLACIACLLGVWEEDLPGPWAYGWRVQHASEAPPGPGVFLFPCMSLFYPSPRKHPS